MPIHRASTARSAGLNRLRAATVKTVLLLALMVPGARPLVAAVTATVINSADQLMRGSAAEASQGDVLLENDRIAVVISAIGHLAGYGLSGGTIIDAALVSDRSDALGELYPYFDDNWPRQAIYTSLEIVEDGSAGRAMIRATGADSMDPAIEVTTEYSLADGASTIELRSTLVNTGIRSYTTFETGDAFQWGTAAKFVPGGGFSVGNISSGPWVGALSDRLAYGYTTAEGEVWGPHGSAWSDLNVAVGPLEPQSTLSYSRFFVLGRDLGEVVARMHQLRATPVGAVECRVEGVDGSLPIEGATIAVDGISAGHYVQMRSDGDGGANTTLPSGHWTLRASATGYLSAEIEIDVETNELLPVDFALEPGSSGFPVGDEITVIQRPLQTVPSFVLRNHSLEIICLADSAAADWEVELLREGQPVQLPLESSNYDPRSSWWTLQVGVPAEMKPGLYDLRVRAESGQIDDTATHAVRVLREYRDDYYFIQITDTHLPDHRFSSEDGAPDQHTETDDLREVIADINLINPEFVLLTGDVVNEGELEDYLNWRSFSRAQKILTELKVPVFAVAGNHDIGGWSDTPPPDGTARRNWWRFFGWGWLSDPPAGVSTRTQDYSFDYGPVHFVGLEAYINYDGWNWSTYGPESFTDEQMQWLRDDLSAAGGSTSDVLFYHYDFKNEIDLRELGVELALYGHTHDDEGSLARQPYNLGTRSVCDGKRGYRLIRVSDGILAPEPTLSAGSTGKNLEVVYSPSNDGSNTRVTARITNRLGEGFEHARLEFIMPAGTGSFQVNGGVLDQIIVSESSRRCSVLVDIEAHGTQTVTVSTSPGIIIPPSSLAND